MKKLRSLIFLILSTGIFAASIVKFPTIISSNTIVLYISAVCGYIGITLLLWMYILGSRAVSKFFNKDYSQILRLHNFLGKYGLLLVFAHPLFVTISYGENILYSFIPSISNEFNIYVTLGRIAFYLLIAIWITSAVVKSNIKYRPWKYIHLLSYLIIPIFLLHIPETGSSYSASIITRLYFSLIVFGFIIFTIIRAYYCLGFDKKSYIVKSNKKINDGIYLISLVPNNIAESLLNINDGEYIYIKFDRFISENHPFSVLHLNKQTGEILIAYKIFGNFTNELSHFPANQILKISGPYGHFLDGINHNNQNVFIAGGIGITPFVNYITNNPENSHLILFNHSSDSAVFVNEMSNILSDKLSIIYSVKNGQTILTRNNHPEALISSIDSQLIDIKNAKFYICAQTNQVKAFVAKLKTVGVPTDNIKFETFDF